MFYIFLTDSMQKVPAANLHITSSAAQTMLGFRSGKKEKEIHVMSNSNRSNKLVIPGAREAMDKFKMEAANDLGV